MASQLAMNALKQLATKEGALLRVSCRARGPPTKTPTPAPRPSPELFSSPGLEFSLTLFFFPSLGSARLGREPPRGGSTPPARCTWVARMPLTTCMHQRCTKSSKCPTGSLSSDFLLEVAPFSGSGFHSGPSTSPRRSSGERRWRRPNPLARGHEQLRQAPKVFVFMV